MKARIHRYIDDTNPDNIALNFEDQNLTDADIPNIVDYINENTFIKSLNLNNTFIGNEGAKALLKLKTKISLSCTGNYFDDDGILALSVNQNIIRLNAVSDHISDVSEQGIAIHNDNNPHNLYNRAIKYKKTNEIEVEFPSLRSLCIFAIQKSRGLPLDENNLPKDLLQVLDQKRF